MARALTPSSSPEPPRKFRAPRAKGSEAKHAHARASAQSAADAGTVRLLHESLLTWYARARRDLPWRRTRDPYSIWLSEVMLQQTRVETVIPYYERFLARWPSVSSLADAPIDDVLAAWSGLGYYRRARMLHAAARVIAGERVFPPDAESLARVKGIGRYTAGAVASIAYGEAAPLVDGNVARVFARLFAIEDDVRGTKGLARLWALAGELVHPGDPGGWNQALMELGATVCVPREPRCLVCPVREVCRARARGLERALPQAKAKAKPRVQRRWALVAARGGAVLLGRRRADVRFGGMWEPPCVDVRGVDARGVDASDGASTPGSMSEAVARLAALTGTKLGAVARVGDVTHILSHRRLEIVVLRAELARGPGRSRPEEAGEYDMFELADPSDLGDRGVSTLARKILGAALEPAARTASAQSAIR